MPTSLEHCMRYNPVVRIAKLVCDSVNLLFCSEFHTPRHGGSHSTSRGTMSSSGSSDSIDWNSATTRVPGSLTTSFRIVEPYFRTRGSYPRKRIGGRRVRVVPQTSQLRPGRYLFIRRFLGYHFIHSISQEYHIGEPDASSLASDAASVDFDYALAACRCRPGLAP
ncbi:hypothetical protein L2E82_51681 [Cichorium intybus]|nr:hypothetical protein L2E82_51681 [Cichorium intybus]